MSEYQYYEFQAVDRSLSSKQMDELRRYSSRAQITPSSFVNVYNYGDFRGAPDKLIDKYFDASPVPVVVLADGEQAFEVLARSVQAQG